VIAAASGANPRSSRVVGASLPVVSLPDAPYDGNDESANRNINVDHRETSPFKAPRDTPSSHGPSEPTTREEPFGPSSDARADARADARLSVAAASRARRAPRADSRRAAAAAALTARDASETCPTSTHHSRISAKKDASSNTFKASAMASSAATRASRVDSKRASGPAAATTRVRTSAAPPSILSP
jgi:hypothetical protein